MFLELLDYEIMQRSCVIQTSFHEKSIEEAPTPGLYNLVIFLPQLSPESLQMIDYSLLLSHLVLRVDICVQSAQCYS
jgi:hypothetical protein